MYFTRDLFALANPLFKEKLADGVGGPKKVLIVVDRAVARHHPRLVEQIEAYFLAHPRHLALARPPLVLPGGEGVKNNPEYVDIIQKAIHKVRLCRHSYVAAVGGGALIDMAGFAAATAHRGIRMVRVPTTVMAQADAAIGVKNGINAFGHKNFLGAFAPPHAVMSDPTFLTTLSARDWLSGVAEAVKVALIKDADFFAFIAAQARALTKRSLPVMEQVVRRSALLHLQHIAGSGDPFELGSSRPLDFGHWSAHKLEKITGHRLRHGEAVAVGLALDATYSHLAGLLPGDDWRRVLDALTDLGLAIFVPELDDTPRLLEGLEEFREHLGGELTVMLLQAIGQGLEVNRLEPDVVAAAVGLLRDRACGRFRQAHPARRLPETYDGLRAGGGPGA